MLKPAAWGFRVESGRSLEQACTARPIEQTRTLKKSCGPQSINCSAHSGGHFLPRERMVTEGWDASPEPQPL